MACSLSTCRIKERRQCTGLVIAEHGGHLGLHLSGFAEVPSCVRAGMPTIEGN